MKTRLRYSVLKIVSEPEIIHQYLTKMRTDEENWQYRLVTVGFHRLMTHLLYLIDDLIIFFLPSLYLECPMYL